VEGAAAAVVVALAGWRRGVVGMLCVLWLPNCGFSHACMCYGVVDDANSNIRGCGVQGHACLGEVAVSYTVHIRHYTAYGICIRSIRRI
jgi:hypothetical protein